MTKELPLIRNHSGALGTFKETIGTFMPTVATKAVFLIRTFSLSQHYSSLGITDCSVHATSIGAVGAEKDFR